MGDKTAEDLEYDWKFWARPSQLLPGMHRAAIQRNDWLYWILLAGRGYGKTRVGAETVRMWAENPRERILMIAPTAADVREVMIEGPSGLMSCYPPNNKPVYYPTRHLVHFPSGAVGITRSAEEPERLRGPQFSKWWGDELAAWTSVDEAWNQVQFGFRVKSDLPLQGIVTTTPKPIRVLKSLIADPDSVVTTGSSYENRANISETYYRKVIAPFEGTRLGRQEINAELLDDVPGALWTYAMIEAGRINSIPMDDIVRIVVAVDPAVTAHEGSDHTGIVVVALLRNAHVIVLEDLSCKKSPLEWARDVIGAYKRWNADVVVGEVNKGGDLVGATIQAIDPWIPFRQVRATRGKLIRAEPIAALYEQGRVHHYRTLPELETEMCEWSPEIAFRGTVGRSPDRMDAMVWGITELVIQQEETSQLVEVGRRVSISRY